MLVSRATQNWDARQKCLTIWRAKFAGLTNLPKEVLESPKTSLRVLRQENTPFNITSADEETWSFRLATSRRSCCSRRCSSPGSHDGTRATATLFTSPTASSSNSQKGIMDVGGRKENTCTRFSLKIWCSGFCRRSQTKQDGCSLEVFRKNFQ